MKMSTLSHNLKSNAENVQLWALIDIGVKTRTTLDTAAKSPTCHTGQGNFAID